MYPIKKIPKASFACLPVRMDSVRAGRNTSKGKEGPWERNRRFLFHEWVERMTGVEPATCALARRRSSQLSYIRTKTMIRKKHRNDGNRTECVIRRQECSRILDLLLPLQRNERVLRFVSGPPVRCGYLANLIHDHMNTCGVYPRQMTTHTERTQYVIQRNHPRYRADNSC